MIRPAHWGHKRDHFYKYMSAETGKLVLKSTKLRWSSPTLFNDPFDVQFDLHPQYDRQSLVRRASDELWAAYTGKTEIVPKNALGRLVVLLRDKVPGLTRDQFIRNQDIAAGIDKAEGYLPEMHTTIREMLSTTQLLCFSETFDNILMWSHYSHHHTGIVARFTCVEKIDSAWGAARPITYEKRMPTLHDEDSLVQLFLGTRSVDVEQTLVKSVFSKAIDWAYEKEWRIFGGMDHKVPFEDIPFDPSELTGIYFGCRIRGADKNDLIAAVRETYSNVELFDAKRSERDFALNFAPSE